MSAPPDLPGDLPPEMAHGHAVHGVTEISGSLSLRRPTSTGTTRALLAVISALALLAVAGVLLALAGGESSPGCCLAPPSSAHWLGTAENGRGLLLEIVRGLGGSALVVTLATVLALVVGTAYGALAASLPRRSEAALMRLVDVTSAIPVTLIVVTVMVTARALRPGVPSSLAFLLDSRLLVVLSVASLQWLSLARVVHARLGALYGRAFVRAARIAGASRWRVFVDHVQPHARGPLLVFGVLALPGGLVAEGFFSFLGFGVDAQHATLGTLVREGARAVSVSPLAFLAPATVLVAACVALQVLGARLREDLR
jgi:oligopeptide transport system permease protein